LKTAARPGGPFPDPPAVSGHVKKELSLIWKLTINTNLN